jgi:ribosomal-protein-alanine N-acetyltransferase
LLVRNPEGDPKVRTLLETDRLLLREISASDLHNLFQLESDPEVMRFIGEGKPRPLEAVERKLEKMLRYNAQNPGLGTWIIEQKDGTFIGSACLKHLDTTEEIEVGYYFLKEYWNNGYATEVARTLIEYGQHELGLRRIVATTNPGNLASIHVLEKCGLVFDGTGKWYGFLSNLYSIEISQ